MGRALSLAAPALPLGLAAPTTALAAPPLLVAWVSLDQADTKSPVFAAFPAAMAELGYGEGQNLLIDTWWGEASLPRLAALRPDKLLSHPDVIVAQGGIALAPLRHANVNRPVLFSMSADPVVARIKASHARPGGQIRWRAMPPMAWACRCTTSRPAARPSWTAP